MTVMADHYRASAEECRRKADAAAGAKDKAAWLDLAHSWLLLLKLEELPVADGDSQERHPQALTDARSTVSP